MASDIPKIGKYEIVSELGKGAMGVVYKGLDPVINRYVAIKTLMRRGGDDDSAQLAERFKQEAQAAGRLNHPAIVSIYEYAEEADRAFIAMEFVDGSTLADLAKRNRVLDLEQIWDLMLKVLDGLNYAHSKGIVHRDIKPSNIMRTATGDVKIADFGIARIESSELTQVGTVIGTPGYMSPEQLLGQRVDNRSDIFSCGILLYELLTGERAFAGTNITSTIYKVVHADLAPASKICPTVPEAIDAVLARVLAKNPADRFQTAREFADAIERVARQQPVPVPAGTPRPDEQETVVKPPRASDDATIVVGRASPGADWMAKLDAQTGTGQRADSVADETAARPPAARPARFPALDPRLLRALLGILVVGAAGGVLALLWPQREKQAPAPPAAEHSPTAEPTSGPAGPAAAADYAPGATFRDCEGCPLMLVVPPGSFLQGSPTTEPGREMNEGPQRLVRIGYPLAVGQYEVTRGQFAQFAGDTDYQNAAGCWVYDGSWRLEDTASWRSPGFAQTDDHP